MLYNRTNYINLKIITCFNTHKIISIINTLYNGEIFMQMVSVSFPRDLINVFKVREKDFPKVVLETLSVELYREGLISIGKAAEIAGVSIWEMHDILAKRKIPLNYYPEDLDHDIETLMKVMK
jgi:predicted HTH domain antitoxin